MFDVMKRAALYLRVSTIDQHPESQLHDLRALAGQRGFQIVREYTDKISGTKAKRPGLIVASRFPVRDVETMNLSELGGTGGAMRCRLESSAGDLLVVNVHLDTPRSGIEPILKSVSYRELRPSIRLRDAGSAAMTAWLGDTPANCIVGGDFNMTCESVIFRRYWSRFDDAFGEAGLGLGHTKFTHWHGVRIDHVLHGSALRCTECRVGLDVGSDHVPVIAILEYVRTQ